MGLSDGGASHELAGPSKNVYEFTWVKDDWHGVLRIGVYT